MNQITRMVKFFEHDLGQPELDLLAEVLRGDILTSGDYTRQLETLISQSLNGQYALAVNSCTAALHLSLVAMGVGDGDLVITSPMTFVATVQAILMAGAQPLLVDVEPDTGNISIDQIAANLSDRVRAIIPVHLYGRMVDMPALSQLCREKNIHLIEDAAHCFEGTVQGYRPGELSDSACFSFYATKNLTSAEGGAVVCRDPELYHRLNLMRNHGMTKTASDRSKEGYKHWDVTMMGYKYNLSNVQAALMIPQFERYRDKHKARHDLAQHYTAGLSTLAEHIYLPVQPDMTHAHHLYPIWLTDPTRRDQLIEHLYAHGISVVVNYRPVHLLSYFRDRYGFTQGMFPAAERIGASTISLPFYPHMSYADADMVVEQIRGFFSS